MSVRMMPSPRGIGADRPAPLLMRCLSKAGEDAIAEAPPGRGGFSDPPAFAASGCSSALVADRAPPLENLQATLAADFAGLMRELGAIEARVAAVVADGAHLAASLPRLDWAALGRDRHDHTPALLIVHERP